MVIYVALIASMNNFCFQSYFAQLRTQGAMSPLASGVPGYHSGPHRLDLQQLYYGQGSPGLLHPQPAGYGYQQQLIPGIRPGVTPNYIMPYNLQRQQGQPGQRMGVRRGGNSQQMLQQQVAGTFPHCSSFAGLNSIITILQNFLFFRCCTVIPMKVWDTWVMLEMVWINLQLPKAL